MPSLATTNRFQQIDQKSLQTFMALSDLGLGHVRDYHGLKRVSILNVVIVAPCCTSWRGWRSASAKYNEPPKRWAKKSPTTNASAWREWVKSLRPCTWGWTAPACRCAPRKSPAASASNRMALPKLARPRSSPCGPRNRGMRKVRRCETQDRSLIRPPSKSPPRWTPASTDPISPNVCCEKRRGEASPKRQDARCWAIDRKSTRLNSSHLG